MFFLAHSLSWPEVSLFQLHSLWWFWFSYLTYLDFHLQTFIYFFLYNCSSLAHEPCLFPWSLYAFLIHSPSLEAVAEFFFCKNTVLLLSCFVYVCICGAESGVGNTGLKFAFCWSIHQDPGNTRVQQDWGSFSVSVEGGARQLATYPACPRNQADPQHRREEKLQPKPIKANQCWYMSVLFGNEHIVFYSPRLWCCGRSRGTWRVRCWQ